MAVKKKTAKPLKREPKSKKAQDTKDVIIKASAQILLKQGFEALNTNLVAKKAGVSIGSLYQYFGSKDEILVFLLNKILDEKIERVKNALSLSMVFESADQIIGHVVDVLFESYSSETAALESILIPNSFHLRDKILLSKIVMGNEIFMPILKMVLISKLPKLKHRDLEAVSFMLVQVTRSVFVGRSLYGSSAPSTETLKAELKAMITNYLIY